jgi:hypothetical protein
VSANGKGGNGTRRIAVKQGQGGQDQADGPPKSAGHPKIQAVEAGYRPAMSEDVKSDTPVGV